MGEIKREAYIAFFETHKKNNELIKMFLNGFNITFASEKHVSNTNVYAYILQPEDFMKEAFGFDRELLLVYSPYNHAEPRSLQAIDELYHQYPFSNRVDSLNCFFMSDDINIEDWLRTSASGENMRIIVPFSSTESKNFKNDPWYIRNKLRKYFFGLDLFGYTLPLNDDTYFFGRQQIVARYIDAIKRNENRGVFGLRKTGKTSLLYKIRRIVSEQKLGEVLFYDCKSPSYRKMHWFEFMYEIYSNICGRLGITAKREYDEVSVIKNLRMAIKDAEIRKRIIIIFDEIEYISFIAPLDEHWKTEFVDFWQTIWSIQSTHRNLIFIISGVNASVTEIDSVLINGRKIQNPLFGIVQSEYLRGLSSDECGSMMRTLGRRMGMKFEHDTINYIYQQYGGHPMLTRLACSKLNMHYETNTRPITITMSQIHKIMPDIDDDLVYYFRHVISELQEFYPDEYEMFELLASGQISDFLELSASLDLTKHLLDYGLIDDDRYGIPTIKLPVAATYVAAELAKKEGRKALYKIIPTSDRVAWVTRRIKSIIQDIRQLEIAISRMETPQLFGENSFPEADKLIEISAVDSETNFISFINILNRCFVESIENYGKSIDKSQYLSQEIASSYHSLYRVLYRIKVYRHSKDHIKLTPRFSADYQSFWIEDTSGFTDPQDQFFVIQQRLLDGLLSSIQIELDRLL
jgi:hypothetical protein